MDETWCAVQDGDGLCATPVATLKPLPLCRAHQLEVALQVVPGLLAESWGEARMGVRTPERIITDALPLRIPEILPNAHSPVVYFVENGSRIKIGTTAHLARRLSNLTLRPASVQLLLSGGAELEAALHQHFVEVRVAKTEWFGSSNELLAFIRRMRQSPQQGELREQSQELSPGSRVDTESARTLVLDHVEALGAQGVVAIATRDFSPLMPLLGRSRSWLVGELQRLLSTGLLEQVEPGQYLISKPENGQTV